MKKDQSINLKKETQDKNYKAKFTKLNLESQINEHKIESKITSEIHEKSFANNEKIYYYQPNRFNRNG